MIFQQNKHASIIKDSRAFTLIELMIVISIIITLLGLVFFPYSYYMQRAHVENTIDIVGQKWILAHKDVRNWKLFDNYTTANKILVFKKGEEQIRQYLLSGTVLPSLSAIMPNPSLKEENPIPLESTILLLGFSGAWLDDEDIVGYYIEAPYGSGAFFTWTTLISSTGVLLTVGYNGADISTGRARQILLRSYLQ